MDTLLPKLKKQRIAFPTGWLCTGACATTILYLAWVAPPFSLAQTGRSRVDDPESGIVRLGFEGESDDTSGRATVQAEYVDTTSPDSPDEILPVGWDSEPTGFARVRERLSGIVRLGRKPSHSRDPFAEARSTNSASNQSEVQNRVESESNPGTALHESSNPNENSTIERIGRQTRPVENLDNASLSKELLIDSDYSKSAANTENSAVDDAGRPVIAMPDGLPDSVKSIYLRRYGNAAVQPKLNRSSPKPAQSGMERRSLESKFAEFKAKSSGSQDLQESRQVDFPEQREDSDAKDIEQQTPRLDSEEPVSSKSSNRSFTHRTSRNDNQAGVEGISEEALRSMFEDRDDVDGEETQKDEPGDDDLDSRQPEATTVMTKEESAHHTTESDSSLKIEQPYESKTNQRRPASKSIPENESEELPRPSRESTAKMIDRDRLAVRRYPNETGRRESVRNSSSLSKPKAAAGKAQLKSGALERHPKLANANSVQGQEKTSSIARSKPIVGDSESIFLHPAITTLSNEKARTQPTNSVSTRTTLERAATSIPESKSLVRSDNTVPDGDLASKGLFAGSFTRIKQTSVDEDHRADSVVSAKAGNVTASARTSYPPQPEIIAQDSELGSTVEKAKRSERNNDSDGRFTDRNHDHANSFRWLPATEDSVSSSAVNQKGIGSSQADSKDLMGNASAVSTPPAKPNRAAVLSPPGWSASKKTVSSTEISNRPIPNAEAGHRATNIDLQLPLQKAHSPNRQPVTLDSIHLEEAVQVMNDSSQHRGELQTADYSNEPTESPRQPAVIRDATSDPIVEENYAPPPPENSWSFWTWTGLISVFAISLLGLAKRLVIR